ncbi:protein ALP1-like [Aphis craccivora]|uniref:Protein ALP1-like n=1 Tax=Aphis craccivora TaxID=307492 RepID=A0A6G0VVZ8_APHCR|nr:protein ALP1-like [Aphis craccivora]
MWVHPLLTTRLSEGAFTINFEGLRKDQTSVFTFYELLTAFVGYKIIKMDKNMQKTITPAEKLAVTLR